MPKHEQTIAINGLDKETTLAISYQAMKDLNWLPQYAGEEKLLGNTPKDWKNFPLQIMITVANDSLTVSSEMFNGESFDMRGKNKKATTAFVAAFETAKKNIDASVLENNKAAINILKVDTLKAAEKEQQQAVEIDKAMNLSGSNLHVTYAIIAINVLVFILMAVDGAGIMDTNPMVHAKWGSNYMPLTLSGDWWRVITSTFIHFGIIHLLMNMYCLYMVGVYLEPMLGKVKYITAYLCTGILASIISIWWHIDIANYNSAGASGAIFGMYGLFLALLSTNLIPKQMRQPLLQSIGIFVVYNLAYGMKGGVDNAAHIGGLTSGFVIGYIYVLAIRKEKERQKMQWIIPLVIVLTIGAAYGYLEQNTIAKENRDRALLEVKDASYKDKDKLDEMINKSSVFEDSAIALLNTNPSDSISRTAYAERLDRAVSFWSKAESAMQSTESLSLSNASHIKANKFLEYIQLRKKESSLLHDLNKVSEEEEDATTKKNLEETEASLRKILEEIKKL